MNLSIKILFTKLNSTKFRGQKKIHVNLSIWKVNSLIDLFFSFILFCSILFYSILFYSILFYSILLYSILFYSILFYSSLRSAIHLYSISWQSRFINEIVLNPIISQVWFLTTSGYPGPENPKISETLEVEISEDLGPDTKSKAP